MLRQLFIRNFTIIDHAEIDFDGGMTVLTGETGAGKSILIDALGLVLGNRADTKWVRPQCSQTDITASFEIQQATTAYDWLAEHELLPEAAELLIRRTVNNDGRSKAFINGRPVTVQQLKELGKSLVNVHSQHEHHALLNTTNQLNRLDHFADHDKLVLAVKQAYKDWKTTTDDLAQARHLMAEQQSQRELLQYQVSELDQLNLSDDEAQELQQEHNQLSHAQHLIETSGFAVNALSEDPEQSLLQQLNDIHKQLTEAETVDNSLQNINAMINEAQISLQEAAQELRHYHDGVSLDPERLQFIETRLNDIHSLARKHQVQAEELLTQHQN